MQKSQIPIVFFTAFPAWPGNWNDYRILAKSNRLQHFINGVLVCDVTDNDTVHAKMNGLIGVQVHVGPPMKVEYREFKLKRFEQ